MSQQRPPVAPFGIDPPWLKFEERPLAPGYARDSASFTAVSQAPPSGRSGPSTARPAIEVFDRQRLAYLRGTQIFNVGIVSSQIISESVTSRNLLIMRNTSATANIYVNFGNNATTASIVRLAVNEVFMWDIVPPQDDIYAIADAAGGQLSVAVSTFMLPV